MGEQHCVAGPSALIGASNFFELAVAAAISLFGFNSGAALGDRRRRADRSAGDAVRGLDRQPVEGLVRKRGEAGRNSDDVASPRFMSIIQRISPPSARYVSSCHYSRLRSKPALVHRCGSRNSSPPLAQSSPFSQCRASRAGPYPSRSASTSRRPTGSPPPRPSPTRP